MDQNTKNPQWFHETLDLKIGEHVYSFRTLSLWDVWQLWPHLRAVKAMMLAGRPLTMMDHLKEILTWLCPALIANDADCKAFTEEHSNILLDFYRKTDFGRMETFGESTTDDAAAAEPNDETDPSEKHKIFVGVIAAAAQFAGMDIPTFVQQRFEFTADAIMGCYKSFQVARGAGEERSPRSWEDVLNESITAMRGATVKIDPENKPPWMKFLENTKPGQEN